MIGVFDSGFGGLTVLRELVQTLPTHDFLYLGDNARSPYGSRSFETIHRYTLEAVEYLFAAGCPLVVLACNTASARALRTIQQTDLPRIAPQNRVLGVIRPCAEDVAAFTTSGHVGILATAGTVRSQSYPLEIAKQHPHMLVQQQACPMWVPLVENGESESQGAEYFIKRDVQSILAMDPAIDLLVLACTHYPLLQQCIEAQLPQGVRCLSQGAIVASKLQDYLHRHPEMEARLTRKGLVRFLTTDPIDSFESMAGRFYGAPVHAEQIRLG